MNDAILCLDIGTSGLKAGVVDSELAIRFSNFSKTGIFDNTFDLDDCLATLCKLVSELSLLAKAQHIDICAINVSGQMGGIIGLKRDGMATTPFDSGVDLESECFNEKLHAILGDSVISTTCGSPRNTAKILRWKEMYPQVYKQTDIFLPLHSLILAKLTQSSPSEIPIDHTMLAFFGNEDAKTLSWSKDLTEALALDLEKFPNICTPCTQIGVLSASAAKNMALRGGIPVFAGLGDQPAGLAGADFTQSDNLFAVLGSTTLLFGGYQDFRPDQNRRIKFIPSIAGDKQYPFTYINGAGLILPWFTNLTSESTLDDQHLLRLTKEAERIPPGSDNLLFLPYFGGSQCPYDSHSRGSWHGLSFTHTKAHLFRSILESIAYGYASDIHYLQEQLHIKPESIACTGGGSKNRLWTQIIADCTSLTVQTQQSYHCTLKGSAIPALVGLGLKNLPITEHKPDIEASNTPNAAHNTLYAPYKSLYEQAATLPSVELNTRLSKLDYQN